MKTGYATAAAQRWKHGFTALELSVVLIIISLMVGTTLVLGNVRVEQEKVESTKNRIALIERALVAYAEINGRLPCPSYPTYKSGDAKFGIESNNPGTCNSDTPDTTWFTTDSAIGSVPTTTLGLPADAMYDSWGRRLTYVVHIPMTADKALLRNSSDSACGGLQIANDVGTVTVPNAMFVILSHGSDGHGAFGPDGTRINARVTNTAALKNASTNSAFTVTAATKSNVYRTQSYYEDTTNAANRFDDIVSYRTRKTFILPSDSSLKNFSVNNNQSAAGWLYVPEYTLPSGKIVPAFEVMKYLASDDGNGLPLSKALVAPWTGQSYENARMACQRLGGYSTTSSLSGLGNQMQYDIISETQWLSISHQLSDDSRNWTDGCYNTTSGSMIAGHRDNSPSNVIAASDNDKDGYYLTGNSADASVTAGNTAYKRSQRRTLYLPSGGVLWDFSGNASQWSYCDMSYAAGENQYYKAARLDAGQTDTGYNLCLSGGKSSVHDYFGGAATMDAGEHWFNTASCIVTSTDYGKFLDIQPKNNLVSRNDGSADHHVGVINSSNVNHLNGITRGANYQAAMTGGVFNIFFGNPTLSRQGFRCVKNIQPKIVSPDNFSGLQIWYDASDLDGDGIVEGSGEAGLQSAATCTKNAAYGKNNGCVEVWRNKAGNDKYHARSMRKNGAASGSANNMPTLKLSAINGMPAINFNGESGRAEWLDTWHGINNNPASDNGAGFLFNTLTEFTMFAVVSGTTPIAIITANSNEKSGLAEGMIYFPHDASAEGHTTGYTFLTSKNFAGADAGKTSCSWTLGDSAPGCLTGARNNSACAQFNLTQNGAGLDSASHVITGVFNPNGGNNQGLIAYVDSATAHPTESAVEIASGALRPTTKTCNGTTVNMPLMLGVQRSWESTDYANANVAEVLIYNRALSAADRLQVEKYLANKYGITLTGVQ